MHVVNVRRLACATRQGDSVFLSCCWNTVGEDGLSNVFCRSFGIPPCHRLRQRRACGLVAVLLYDLHWPSPDIILVSVRWRGLARFLPCQPPPTCLRPNSGIRRFTLCLPHLMQSHLRPWISPGTSSTFPRRSWPRNCFATKKRRA